MLHLSELRRQYAAGENFRFLFFWGHQPGKEGEITSSCLSQWYPAPFETAGVVYPTAEHWMMAAKARLFGDQESVERILNSPDPKTAKSLGRSVKNFDEDVWRTKSRSLVTEGNLAKFSQNEALGGFLLGTHDQILVEASPFDRIWGIGLNATDERVRNPQKWRGQNLLGFALMDVRESLAGILRID